MLHSELRPGQFRHLRFGHEDVLSVRVLEIQDTRGIDIARQRDLLSSVHRECCAIACPSTEPNPIRPTRPSPRTHIALQALLRRTFLLLSLSSVHLEGRSKEVSIPFRIRKVQGGPLTLTMVLVIHSTSASGMLAALSFISDPLEGRLTNSRRNCGRYGSKSVA